MLLQVYVKNDGTRFTDGRTLRLEVNTSYVMHIEVGLEGFSIVYCGAVVLDNNYRKPYKCFSFNVALRKSYTLVDVRL